MSKRSFLKHIISLKKTAAFIIICYLLIVIPLFLSYSKKGDPLDLTLLICGFTLIFVWIMYYQFAEYNRLYRILTSSGIIEFLYSNNFQISERNTGWNYEIDIYGKYRNCLILLVLSKQKGDIWNKYFIGLHGAKYIEGIDLINSLKVLQTYAYPHMIKLTKANTTKDELKKHIDLFVNQLVVIR